MGKNKRERKNGYILTKEKFRLQLKGKYEEEERKGRVKC